MKRIDATALLSRCELCPRRCGVNRLQGERGFCGAGATLRAARAALHHWEEPCISGTRGSGTVFFSHCTLGCVYCQNYPISIGGEGRDLLTGRLAEVFLSLEAQGAHNINLVTPTQFLPQIIPELLEAKRRGLSIPIVYNCGGYERVETLKMLEGLIDIWLPDYKYAVSRPAERWSAAPDYPEAALAAIDEMVRQVGEPVFDDDGMLRRGVLIRHLLLPGQLANSLAALKLLWERYGERVLLSLMSQYTPTEPCKNDPVLSRKVSERHYDALLERAAELGITRCYVQEAQSADEAYIPLFDGEGF